MIRSADWLWRLSTALAAAVVASAQTPVLDCAAQNPATGDITAFFGYTSNTVSTTIPLGSANNINTGIVYGTIRTTFPVGTEHVLFSVRFDKALTVVWTL